MTSGASPAGRTSPTPAPAAKTEQEIKALMASEKYSGPPEKRDPAVVKEVDAWFATKYAPKPGA